MSAQMKDKLREFLKTGTRKTVMRGESGRYPNGEGWGRSWNEEVVEFNAKKLDAAMLDAEGDGAVVGEDMFDTASKVRDYLNRELPDENRHIFGEALAAPTYAQAHPARSGVVSDEDVQAACDTYNNWCDLHEDMAGVSYCHEVPMRAALEHFAGTKP